MNRKWTKEEAWDWYDKLPFVNGCNYRPGNTRFTDYYSKDTHEESSKVIEKEVRMAADLGLNSFRLYIPPKKCWDADRELTIAYFEEFISMCARYGISLMPELFSDCAAQFKPDANGKPVHFTDLTDQVGTLPTDDPAVWPEYEQYLLDFVLPHKDDPRIIVWNIWNEAGNSKRDKDMLSIPFLKRVFGLLRENDVSQPLSADCWGLYEQVEGRYNWNVGLAPIEEVVNELSDVITWHYYGDWLHTKKYMLFLKEKYGRPMLNTEWGHRPWGSFIPAILPLFYKYNCGSYFFGFANGTCFDMSRVWNWIRTDDRIDQNVWMHGIYQGHEDGTYTVYDQDDIDALLEMKAILEKDRKENS